MRKIFLASLLLVSGLAHAQTYNLFKPANGILKGSTSTYVTSAAASSDVISLWSGTCNSGTFLRADGACAAAGAGTVTSVALTVPSGFSVSGSPVTSSGTLGITGTLNVSAGGIGVGTLTGVAKGNGTSAFTAAASSDVISLWSGTCNSGTFLRADGACAAAGGSAAGSTSNVQFNASGAFSASTAFSYTESLDAGGGYFPSILQLGATGGTVEGAIFGTGALTLSAFATKVTSGATYYDYFNNGYIQMYPGATDGGSIIVQSGNAPSNGAGGTILIEAGNATGGGNNNGGELDLRSGTPTGSGIIGLVKIQPGGTDQLQIASNGVQVGSPTGGYKGTGTINATGFYVNGTAVASAFSGAAVHSTGTTSCNVGSFCAVAYAAEDYDTGSFHDNSTNNSRVLLPNITGFAQCSATIYITSGTTSAAAQHAIEVLISVNGAPGSGIVYGQSTNNFYETPSGSTILGAYTTITAPISTSNGTDYAQAYFDTQGFATAATAATNGNSAPNRFSCWAVK